jgi:hypothetical protein
MSILAIQGIKIWSRKMNHQSITSYILFLALCLLPPLSQAAPIYNETSDAGQTLNTATNLGLGINVIYGSLTNDVDMYSFDWNGGQFTADTLQSSFDTALYLFSSSGLGLFKNDDGFNIIGPSRISTTLSRGSYLLAITDWNVSAMNSINNSIFPDNDYSALLTPTASDAILNAFATEGEAMGGTYQINISARVDTPQTLLLISLGLITLHLTSKDRHSNPV